jgi:hypothetical protein
MPEEEKLNLGKGVMFVKGRLEKLSLRGHHQWRELFPMLEELGIEVSVERKLPGIEKAYRHYLRQLRDEKRAGMVKPSPE